MARPTKDDLNSGNQGWDGVVDDNFEKLFDAPIPIHASASLTQSNLQSSFPASAHDRCLVWVNHTVHGYMLYYSNGTTWIPYGNDKMPKTEPSTTYTMLVTDKFIRATGTTSYDIDLIAAASYSGRTLFVRNDSTMSINLDPSGSENINGSSSSLAVASGATAIIYSDGTEWWQLG